MTISEHHIHTLADLAWGPMNAKEAAAWLGTTYDGFRALAPSLPREYIPRLGHRYFRGDLYRWSRECGNDVATDTHKGSQIVTPIAGSKRRGGRDNPVKRLI